MILLIISILSPLVPLIAGIKNRFTLLWLYVMAGLFFDILIFTLKRGFHVNHYWASNVSMLSEFLFISFFYRKRIFRNDQLFYCIVITLGAFFIADTFRRSFFTFNTFGASMFYLVYILYSVAGMYTLLKEQKVTFLSSSYFFWVNFAFIIYASGSFLLFLFRFYLLDKDVELLKSLWAIFFLPLNIFNNCILAIALYKYKKE